MNKINMIGWKCGKLTVIDALPRKNKHTYWKCQCECGTETEVEGSSLRRGRIKSCGLCGSGGKRLNLTGKRFGRLTALCIFEKKSVRNETYWKCRCDCGNETDVRIGHLTSGRTISCGCALIPEQNEYEIVGDIAYVKLKTRNGNNNRIMICDADVWERLKEFSWSSHGGGYASTSNKDGKLKYKEFHRNVIEIREGMIADHINRNRYDNRRCNLREVTVQANAVNRSLPSNNTTGHMGLIRRENGKWQATIVVSGNKISLGTFDNKEDAIKARKGAEEKYFKPLFDL